ncbi:MAG: 1-acyl-sn-glycerol-3-phosphate acyltransferase [Bacteriovorax sp.]
MNKDYEKRSQTFINSLRRTIWPVLKTIFRIKIEGLENVPSKGPLLFIANHNVGALIESHSSLFVLQERIPGSTLYGFTHPSLFKLAGISHYFQKIGAVPSTYDVASEVLSKGDSLMIFPGGNRQALRSVWHYRKNQFEWSHGWAKIACQHRVPVVPITFKGSHFVNPIIISGGWISKVLVLPWLLGVKWSPVSLGQVLLSVLTFFLLKNHVPLALNVLATYLVFVFTPLVLLVPFPVTMKIHPPLMPSDFSDQKKLEEEMGKIMGEIYS